MPWILSPRATTCNRCHAAIPVDAECYRGDLTGQHWCRLCGQELREFQPPVRVSAVNGEWDRTDMRGRLDALMRKAGGSDLSSRIVGSE